MIRVEVLKLCAPPPAPPSSARGRYPRNQCLDNAAVFGRLLIEGRARLLGLGLGSFSSLVGRRQLRGQYVDLLPEWHRQHLCDLSNGSKNRLIPTGLPSVTV